MAMKCCTKLETAKKRCPIVFQGHPSNFKVTRDKTSPILTQIGRFRTIGRSQLSNPSDLPCYYQSRISSDTVTENYGQVWLQFVMTACVFPRRPLAMLWHARGPEAATHDSWPAPKCCWNCIDILNFGHHLSTSIHCPCSLRQWYTVKSNNKSSLVVMLNCHCQIIDI